MLELRTVWIVYRLRCPIVREPATSPTLLNLWTSNRSAPHLLATVSILDSWNVSGEFDM